MTKKKKLILVAVFLLFWLILMWRLSSANGTETLRDSMTITKKIGAWLYDAPTETQLSALNLHLRKLAHIFLYVVFGGISALLWHLLLEKRLIWMQMLPALFCCTAIAFLDELHKTPIAGRHFSVSESLLNAASAAIIIFFFFLIYVFVSHSKKRRAI